MEVFETVAVRAPGTAMVSLCRYAVVVGRLFIGFTLAMIAPRVISPGTPLKVI